MRLIWQKLGVALVVWCCFAAAALAGPLSSADRQAIAAHIETYRTAWLAGDAAAIKALFHPDAVFMPHHGLQAVIGLEALSAFWWPPDGPKVEITRFDFQTERIEGTSELAYAWGRQELEWTQTDGKGVTRTRTRGNHLTIFRHTPEGWKIALQMGDDEPNERY
jgi:uncharacterized protein (TIGR02246 family)